MEDTNRKRTIWQDSLLAVVAGNVVHFLILEPRLPERLRHHAFQLDPGLAIDFVVCLAAFAVVCLIRRR